MKKFDGYQKGINLGGWLSQCVSYEKEHFDTFILEEDIAQIASWGMDHVRLPIDYDIIEEEDGTVKEEGHEYIVKCIDWCKKHGLNIVLDVHKACGFMFDKQAVPDPDKFFTDVRLQDRFIATWTELIKRYAQYEDMMAFELLNEVVNPAFAKKWNEIAKRAIKTLREYAPNAYILIGGVQHNNVLSVPLLDEPYDDKIVYNFHCYEPLCFTHQHAHWVENIDYDLSYPAEISLYKEKSELLNQDHAGAIFSGEIKEVGPDFFKKMFEGAIEYATKMGVPLYCGEYGVIDQAPLADTVNWLRDITEVFNEYGIGRSLWTYKNKDFGIVDEHYAPIKDEMVAILSE